MHARYGQTDEQTDGKVISKAERLLRNVTLAKSELGLTWG